MNNNIIIWLTIAIIAYWFLCLWASVIGFKSTKTARDYFIAGRSLSMPMFVLAATATTFSGWTFISHPGLIYSDGFPVACASFYAITIPLAGVFFLKRQWMLGRRCGFVTPGEMLAAYYQTSWIRLWVVVIALLFSVFYIAVQLRASGFLLHILTQSTNIPDISILGTNISFSKEGAIDINGGMILLSLFMMIYVIIGGLRGVAWVDTLQAVLLAAGICFIGWLVLDYVGGWGKLMEGIKALSLFESERNEIILSGKNVPESYNKYTAIVAPIQLVSDKEATVGSHWTGMFILTFMIALMGNQSSPEFSMWAFATKDPKAFAFQQVVASAGIMGFILIFFTAIQGIGGHFLGADVAFREAHPELTANVLGVFLNDEHLASYELHKSELLVPLLMRMMADTTPWLTALLAICALAAIQSTAAPYMSTIGSMISRDLINAFYKQRTHQNLNDSSQKRWARISSIMITIIALVIAINATDTIAYLGGLAVAFGLQMTPALMGICWFPWFTRKGIITGLIIGLITVFLTEGIVTGEGKLLEEVLPWGKWPGTIHSAGWGIFFNLLTALTVSILFQDKQRDHREKYHAFFREYAPLTASSRKKWGAFILVIIWALFAIGPFAILGNSNFIFGEFNKPDTWKFFGMPPIWAWQIFWWLVGLVMMYFLAYKMEFSTAPKKVIKPLQEDASELPQLEKIIP
jgi:Na+/proline symporter